MSNTFILLLNLVKNLVYMFISPKWWYWQNSGGYVIGIILNYMSYEAAWFKVPTAFIWT